MQTYENSIVFIQRKRCKSKARLWIADRLFTLGCNVMGGEVVDITLSGKAIPKQNKEGDL